MALGDKCQGYIRMLLAFLGTIFLLAGIALQFVAAGNLYGIRLGSLCKAHSGSEELSDRTSFNAFIDAAFTKRAQCLALPLGDARTKCCSVYFGLCARPDVPTRADLDKLDPIPKMEILTTVVGVFMSVYDPSSYDRANPEFWCKNCPNDWRKNCPFDPVDSDNTTSGVQVDKVCDCPGGQLSKTGVPFWATITDNQLATRYLLCSDKADVYEEWANAIFPEWDQADLSQVRQRFEAKCWQGKGSIGYILTAGPVLATFTGLFSIAGLFKRVANTPVPVIGFNLGMVAVAVSLVSFWGLSLTGASGLISRYAVCKGYESPVVVNGSKAAGTVRHTPELYNGAPCADLNSEGQYAYNPFISELGSYNGGYVSGGILTILALFCMLAINAKVSDVVMEAKLAGDSNGNRAKQEALDDD
eukprot:CAMPEP_0173390898 /NCGR_PEP_ID=MMETSP1356-20130122/16491_1 /TAXON_ID=77927 ORGANISM="Hemiselmis virescens, Strain PCC157" /NCGR_SAMPLE_ID=MMETSP1356 /ASSEMBLY_ACC=CAM_ASM_000847 /LENGTH=415 /DNA_ID=CAMNT_0014348393 /DNA_START=109 /DNA_END=1356 /DNA_ORIENTATION=-